MKHTIKSITWHWNEGIQYFDSKNIKLTLKEADDYLKRVARDMRPLGGYNKVKFTATFEGGEAYEGRFDVHHIDEKQETSTGALSFLDHIIDHIKFYCGESKPNHWTENQYKDHVENFGITDESEMLAWYERLGLVANSEARGALQDAHSKIQQIMEDISNLDGVELVLDSLGECLESIDQTTCA